MLFSSRISLLQFILSRILPSVNRAHHTFPQCYSHPVYRSYNSYYPALCLLWTEHITLPPMLFSSRISLVQFILSRIPPSVDRAHHTFPQCYSHPVYRSYNSYYPVSCLQWTEHITLPPMLFSSRISLLQFILSRIPPSVDRAHHTFPQCYSHPVYRSYNSYYPVSCLQWTEHITLPPMLFSSRISLLQFILSRILPSVNRAHHTFPQCYSHPVYRSYNSYYPASRLQWTEHITLSPNAILIPYIALTIHTIPHPAFSDRAHHTSPNAILIPYIGLTIHTIPHCAFCGQSTSHFPQCYSHPVYRSYNSYYLESRLQWTEHITLFPNAILIPYIALTIHTISNPAFSGQSTSHFSPMLFSSRISLLQFILSRILPSVDRAHHTSPNAILIPYIALTIHTISNPAFSGQSTSHFSPMLFSSRISLLQFILSRILPSVDRAHHTSPNAILIPYIALTIHIIPHPAFSGQSTSHFPPMLFSSRI